MSLFEFILFGTLCASYTWIFASFLNFGKFSAIISSNTFSIPFSLSSPSGTCIMHRLAYFILFHRFCKLLSFSHLFFCLEYLSFNVSRVLRSPFNISVGLDLLLLHSFSFCCSEKFYCLFFYSR